MSRIANKPVQLLDKVTATIDKEGVLTIKGPKGALNRVINKAVNVEQKDKELFFSIKEEAEAANDALAGTERALVSNMVIGVTEGFSKKLELVGVGYRAQVQDKVLNLTLGFSHPVSFSIPEGIKIETPSQTEIVITSMDCQLLGQVAAEIRAYRSPEPYKGKGVKYSDERIILKETKK